jgi:hypothetical protein
MRSLQSQRAEGGVAGHLRRGLLDDDVKSEKTQYCKQQAVFSEVTSLWASKTVVALTGLTLRGGVCFVFNE